MTMYCKVQRRKEKMQRTSQLAKEKKKKNSSTKIKWTTQKLNCFKMQRIEFQEHIWRFDIHNRKIKMYHLVVTKEEIKKEMQRNKAKHDYCEKAKHKNKCMVVVKDQNTQTNWRWKIGT